MAIVTHSPHQQNIAQYLHHICSRTVPVAAQVLHWLSIYTTICHYHTNICHHTSICTTLKLLHGSALSCFVHESVTDDFRYRAISLNITFKEYLLIHRQFFLHTRSISKSVGKGMHVIYFLNYFFALFHVLELSSLKNDF